MLTRPGENFNICLAISVKPRSAAQCRSVSPFSSVAPTLSTVRKSFNTKQTNQSVKVPALSESEVKVKKNYSTVQWVQELNRKYLLIQWDPARMSNKKRSNMFRKSINNAHCTATSKQSQKRTRQVQSINQQRGLAYSSYPTEKKGFIKYILHKKSIHPPQNFTQRKPVQNVTYFPCKFII